MKNLLFIVVLLFSFSAYSQNARIDAKGNFHQIGRDTVAQTTGKTFTTTKGEVFPVYKSAKGKYFIYRTSKKTGNKYKQYIITK